MRRLLVVAPVVCALAACSKTPTNPSDGPLRVFEGQTVSAVDGAPSPNVSVRIGAKVPVFTDRDGLFAVDVGSPTSHQVVLRGGSIVDRQTAAFGPMAERIRLSLIPATFDLTAFDEMFRASRGQLQRWTAPPSLVVLATVMRYRNTPGNEYEAADEELTDKDVTEITDHLTDGLALLTGGTFAAFQSIVVERPAAGARVNVLRDGRIVVGRYSGIMTFTNTVGYGQWSELPNGTIVGGAMFLDRDFDRHDARRRLLRIHELGHALGYQHVGSRPSVMNPAIGSPPTEFDRDAARIAFQRPPGNRAPDTDPQGFTGTFSVAAGGGQWMPPVFCR